MLEPLVSGTHSRGRWIAVESVANSLWTWLEAQSTFPPADSEMLPVENRRNQVFRLAIPELPGGESLMLKRHWLNPVAPPWQRFNDWVAHFIRDTMRNAFFGTRALQEAGIDTLEPLAWWSHHVRLGVKDSYFLYRPVPCDFSVRDVMIRLRADRNSERREQFGKLVESIGHILRRMHDQGLRHHDVALGNWLVAEENGERKIYLIDNDRVTRTWVTLAGIRRRRDRHSMRRLRLEPAMRTRFLEAYQTRGDLRPYL